MISGYNFAVNAIAAARQYALVLPGTLLLLLAPAAMAAGDLSGQATDALLQAGNHELTTNTVRAEAIYAELQNRYGNLPVPEKDATDYLGARLELMRGDMAKSTASLEALLRRDLGNDLLIQVKTYLAGNYVLLSQFDNAFKTQLSAMNAVRPDTTPDTIMETLSRSAYMSALAGAYPEAISYSVRLHDMAKALNNNRYLCRAEAEHGMAERAIGDYAKSEMHLLAARDYCNDAGEANSARFASQHLARTWLAMGEYDKVVTMLERMEKFITPENYWALGVADNQFLLAEGLVGIGDWDKARFVAAKGLKLGQQIEYPMAVREASKTLANIAAHDGDYAKAYEYIQIHLAAAKSVADETEARSLAYARARYDAEDKARQITDLQRENRVLALEQALRDQERRNAYMAAAVALVIIIALCLILYRMRRQRLLFRQLAETDSLTGVSSRHHVLAAGEILATASENGGDRMGVILFDLDEFKAINDTHGHAAGDWALRAVANACRPHIRGRDVFGRFGGEEFIILCRDVTPASATTLAERCRKAIAAINTQDSGAIFELSASFGFAVSGVRDDGTPAPIRIETLIRKADDALYQAKAGGRNQVVDHAVLPQII
ncbi:MAG: GGDEF domain-containing protein [Alphaproteobacteria bacterium]|nr:MAG: GGDEF domain-containing protein [Alphaproteobacteria bacterium]